MPKEETQKLFFEIINWEIEQEYMRGDNNYWYKQVTSILDNERIFNLDDASFRLLINLSALAARMGTHILPADTKWLMRRMAFLQGEPDLKPLFEAKDMYGRDNPFIRYCDPPDQQQKNDTSSEDTKKNYSRKRGQKNDQQRDKVSETANEPLYEKAVEIASKTGYVSANNLQKELKIGHPKALSIIDLMREKGLLGEYVRCKGYVYIASSEKTKTEENRIDKIREEEIREESDSYRNPEEKREKKEKTDLKGKEQNRVKQIQKNPQAEAQRQKKELLQAQTDNSGRKPVNPTNPMESDESAVSSYNTPKQPTSSFRGGKPQSIGRIIKAEFPLHWNDPECDEFGGLVIGALGYTVDKTNEFSKGEWGTFAHWLFRLKGVCKSDTIIQEIKQKMIEKASWINSPKCKRKDNKGALLIHIMDGELEKRGIKLPNSRASPA